jgi:phage internal scaffolding protein
MKNVSVTQQQFVKQCDINNVVRRYLGNGVLQSTPTMSQARAQYGDFTQITDYHTACNIVVQAQASFNMLPANIRSRFDNDPGKFIKFLEEPKNLDEAKKLGIIVERQPVDPQRVIIVGNTQTQTQTQTQKNDEKIVTM